MAPTDPRAEMPASERAYDHVKSRILRGELTGGTVLSEVAVSHELALSRTPVHEAFLRLEGEGLLALEARKGAIVVPLAPREVDDVTDMRLAIESACAARTIRDGAAPGLAAELDLVLARQREHKYARDLDAYADADREFHLTVIHGARNVLAATFSGMLDARVERLRRQVLRTDATALEATYREHRALVTAIREGDAELYGQLLAAHVQRPRGNW